MLRFTAHLWEHSGDGSWHFVTVPVEVSDEVRAEVDGPRRGFGSVRVEVTVGTTTWRTSVFPQSDGTFVLPVKKAVRRGEDLLAGDDVSVALTVLD